MILSYLGNWKCGNCSRYVCYSRSGWGGERYKSRNFVKESRWSHWWAAIKSTLALNAETPCEPDLIEDKLSESVGNFSTWSTNVEESADKILTTEPLEKDLPIPTPKKRRSARQSMIKLDKSQTQSMEKVTVELRIRNHYLWIMTIFDNW